MATRMYEVQQKVYEALNSNLELKAIVNGIFDYVPENTVTPYITFGHITSETEGDKTHGGERLTFILDIWSESKGRKEAIAIVQLIERTLSNEIELQELISQKVVNREVNEQSYGLYHGAVEVVFRI